METIKTSRRGNVAFLVLFAFATLIGAYSLYDYLRGAQVNAKVSATQYQAKNIGEQVAVRIRNVLGDPRNIVCDAAKFGLLRNIVLTSQDLITYESTATAAPDCIISAAEKALLSKYKIQIYRSLQTPEPLTSDISVSIEVDLLHDKAAATVQRVFRLGVLQPSFFGVSFYGAPPAAGTLVTTNNSSKAIFYSPTFYSNASASLALSKILPVNATSPRVIFQAPFYYRPSALLLNAGDTSLDGSVLSAHFPQGFESNAFADLASSYPLQGPSGAALSEWNQSLDYHYMQSDPLAYPLATGMSVPTTTQAYAASRSTLTNSTLPSASLGYSSIDDTCQPMSGFGLGTLKYFIFLHTNRDFTLDFPSNPASANSKVFCGSLVTRTLTINTDPTTVKNYAIFGLIVANQIIINGKGKVHFYHPSSQLPMPAGLSFPNGASLGSMHAQFMALGSSIGSNFFMPLTNAGLASADFRPKLFNSPLLSVTTPTHFWINGLNPVQLSGLFPATGACSGASPCTQLVYTVERAL